MASRCLAAALILAAAGSVQAQVSPGDMNCDGVVDGLDIPLFVDCVLTGNCDHCQSLGACCDASGGCVEVVQADCSGTWLGDGVTCDPNPCIPVSMALVPAGEFEMGDCFDEGDADERPVHDVYLDAYCIEIHEVTNRQYVDALNWAKSQGGLIEVEAGVVKKAGDEEEYCDTTITAPLRSRIIWSGAAFSVVSRKEDHAVRRVSWYGAAAFCNWRSVMEGRTPCYDLETWVCDFDADGFRLPTEAEWEKAAAWDPELQHHFRFGEHTDGCGATCLDGERANFGSSGDPYEAGAYPWTTPAGFYNGELHHKVDFDWPGSAASYQTQDAKSYYGCRDMAGSALEWCNDWYDSAYYSSSPYDNPTGPAFGATRVMHDGGWCDSLFYCRSASRYECSPDERDSCGGFRCVLGHP